MLSVADVQQRAAKRFANGWRTWACDLLAAGWADGGVSDSETFPISFGLKPPTERAVLADSAYEAVQNWVHDWRTYVLPGALAWETRNWPRVGHQRIPVRVTFASPAEVSRWAGEDEVWHVACSRVEDVRDFLYREAQEVDACTREAVLKAVHKSLAAWCALDNADWQRMLSVLQWLLHHPHEQLFARQLPIRGVHTKWIEAHGGVLQPLYQALTGQTFSFATPGHLFRCAALDSRLAWGDVRTFALEAQQLVQLPYIPERVLICENLVNVESLASSLELSGTLVIHGGGFAVTALSQVTWLQDIPLYYWGDLDTSGFAILHALRTHFPHVVSVMMDTDTLRGYLDLAVEEPKPFTGTLECLSQAERETVKLLRAGDEELGLSSLRLEQERIEWAWALEKLREVLDT